MTATVKETSRHNNRLVVSSRKLSQPEIRGEIYILNQSPAVVHLLTMLRKYQRCSKNSWSQLANHNCCL